MQMNEVAGGALVLSELMLGSMTWGIQNTEAEAHAQIDAALANGVNAIDTAEMYPTPVDPAKVGRTEEIIGTWNAANPARRGDYVLATKVAGDNGGAIRGGRGYDGQVIREAVEASLKRLRTDYVDIYQLHWPMRGSYMFRKNWTFDPTGQDHAGTLSHMRDVLGAMKDLVAEGKVRHFGLSNESAWGTATWLRLAREMGAPKVVTVQNEYSLLCRLYDTDMAELSHHEDVRLLAYSPLACGFLTGKYQDGDAPEGSRLSLSPTMGGRNTPRVRPAAAAYLEIADRHGLDPVHLALAFCRTRPFMGAAIFGATTPEHVERALGSTEVTLSDEVMAEIDAAHRAHPMPY